MTSQPSPVKASYRSCVAKIAGRSLTEGLRDSGVDPERVRKGWAGLNFRPANCRIDHANHADLTEIVSCDVINDLDVLSRTERLLHFEHCLIQQVLDYAFGKAERSESTLWLNRGGVSKTAVVRPANLDLQTQEAQSIVGLPCASRPLDSGTLKI